MPESHSDKDLQGETVPHTTTLLSPSIGKLIQATFEYAQACEYNSLSAEDYPTMKFIDPKKLHEHMAHVTAVHEVVTIPAKKSGIRHIIALRFLDGMDWRDSTMYRLGVAPDSLLKKYINASGDLLDYRWYIQLLGPERLRQDLSPF